MTKRMTCLGLAGALLALASCGGAAEPSWDVLGEIETQLLGERVSRSEFGLGLAPDADDGVEHRPAEEWRVSASPDGWLFASTRVPHPAGRVWLGLSLGHVDRMEPDVPYVSTGRDWFSASSGSTPAPPGAFEHPVAGVYSCPEDATGAPIGESSWADRVVVTLREDEAGARRYEVGIESTWRAKPYVVDAWFDEALCMLAGE